ncbi:hypothetical protein GCM10011383_19200 [Hymenobacter cavernae]|uniref:Uncharacterized protein n=1 Tax=Hymenobacter cavernae TaxID=2044852 RepID=A0ABQ1U0I7_9BACT|nr:hypothetical protein GCM10011383_19200 [Hymenobacter cavernae]
MMRKAGHVGELEGAVVEGIKVIQAHHAVPVRQEPFAEVRTNKACAAGDQNRSHKKEEEAARGKPAEVGAPKVMGNNYLRLTWV